MTALCLASYTFIMTDGYIECNSVKIYYRRYGEFDGKPLILLHGNGEDGGIFDAVAKRFAADGFCAYTPDSRCHGKSEKGHLSYDNMAEDMAAFVRGILEAGRNVGEGHETSFALYGFSDGGIVALLLAMKYPGLLARIAVSGVNLTPSALNRSFRLSVRLGYFFTRSPLLRLMLKEPNINFSDLSRISAPTLVLAGEKDIIPASHTQAVAAAISSAECRILKGETHASYVLDADKLHDVLKDFLRFGLKSETESDKIF